MITVSIAENREISQPKLFGSRRFLRKYSRLFGDLERQSLFRLFGPETFACDYLFLRVENGNGRYVWACCESWWTSNIVASLNEVFPHLNSHRCVRYERSSGRRWGGSCGEWGIQDLEEELSVPLWPGHVARVRMAQFDCSMAAWHSKVCRLNLNWARIDSRILSSWSLRVGICELIRHVHFFFKARRQGFRGAPRDLGNTYVRFFCFRDWRYRGYVACIDSGLWLLDW